MTGELRRGWSRRAGDPGALTPRETCVGPVTPKRPRSARCGGTPGRAQAFYDRLVTQPHDSPPDREPGPGSDSFLSFVQVALDRTEQRLPGVDRAAMAMVLLVHRVATTLVYDLESTVHRPAGWSWSAFRLLFTLWVSGAQEASRAAELTGMSRAAVSSLAKTLSASGLLDRVPGERDRRGVVLTLTETGTHRLEETFRCHNHREGEWAGLLEPGEVEELNRILAKIVSAAQTEEWVNLRF